MIMNRSYSKIRHIQESNQLLEKRILNEQITSNVTQLVKDIINFIWDMNIVPGPIDGAKLLYDLFNEKDPIQTIKDFVRDRIPTPQKNWEKIESSMDKVSIDLEEFKNEIYNQLKNKL
jgi:hypothetical protein